MLPLDVPAWSIALPIVVVLLVAAAVVALLVWLIWLLIKRNR